VRCGAASGRPARSRRRPEEDRSRLGGRPMLQWLRNFFGGPAMAPRAPSGAHSGADLGLRHQALSLGRPAGIVAVRPLRGCEEDPVAISS
jgi:hypothetical protein